MATVWAEPAVKQLCHERRWEKRQKTEKACWLLSARHCNDGRESVSAFYRWLQLRDSRSPAVCTAYWHDVADVSIAGAIVADGYGPGRDSRATARLARHGTAWHHIRFVIELLLSEAARSDKGERRAGKEGKQVLPWPRGEG